MIDLPPGVQLTRTDAAHTDEVLTPEALDFAAQLHRSFNPERVRLLQDRVRRQERLDAGELPDFLPNPIESRDPDWRVAPAPPDFDDRRVEITGPAEPKMMINALNSGASVFMCDFEDALSPTWDNVVTGHWAVSQAVRRQLTFETDEKAYALDDEIATLCIRPRGWHLDEAHALVDGAPISASIFDFGIWFFHNAAELRRRGSGPYLYLPKLESHLEAALWNEVFVAAQAALDIPRGTIRATVLIETILAAFEMDEILYELREHAAGLNAGRWDYIFSIIKKFRAREDMVLPDRAQVTMTVPFMRAYTELLVQTCHRRGAHAIGGMAAFIPSRRDPEVNERALAAVRADKERESADGFDGTWVAHPDLVPLAREISAVAVSSIRLAMAAAPVPCSQASRYCSATETFWRTPSSVISPPALARSRSWSSVTATSSRWRAIWLGLSPRWRSKTSIATGTRSGWATQVPSKPCPASRSLSSRTLASARSLTSGSRRLGMKAAIPPIACAPRRWQVATSSSAYARMNGAAMVIAPRSGRMKSAPASRKFLMTLNR